MRRILIALVMSGAVVVAAPTGALAVQHHSRHHHARHHRSSRRHSRVRHKSFGRLDTQPSGTSSQAGTVSMFTDNGNGTGVLTITLNDGSTVTGNVTTDTNISCMSASASQQGDDQGDNGDSQGGTGDDQGDSGSSSSSGDDQGDSGSSSSTGDDQGNGGTSGGSGDDNGGSGDDQGDNGDDQGDNGAQTCSTASLTPPTPVAEANLEITSSGAVWTSVELITP